MKTILGIDEAGRGAVLGPLVVAGAAFFEDDETLETLYAHNVRDSKLLTATAREKLARLVRSLKHRYRTTTVSPARIDKHSLNELEIQKTASLINALKPHTTFLDVPTSGAGIGRYCAAVGERCSHACDIEGANGMDGTNIVVAAASILAKERREHEVRKLHKTYGDFGSGYPSDPKTREWLKNWRQQEDSWPEVVRTKWATLRKLQITSSK